MYNFKEIEKKWQAFWNENKTFKAENPSSDELSKGQVKPKYYCLDMFPYPSGAWLHVGHPEWYTANDIIARYKHANWYNVLHPMWRDAFGLPAENYAIKTWTHPRITTDKNIATFKAQIKSLGFSYDWDREIDTTDPKYYKWTQWIFLKMFEKGLAYEQDLPINYCPSCKTGLANEEVLSNNTCDRCWTIVEKKKIRQWVLAITKYADRLAKDVDKLDWPEGIKDMQRNWIWRSEGCEFRMERVSEDYNQKISEDSIDNELNEKTHKIIWIAMNIQNELWPWLEEKVYKKAFKLILEKNNFTVKEEVKNPIIFEWEEIGYWKIDLLIDNEIVIELKSQKSLKPDYFKQIRKYLNQSNYKAWLLINFYNKNLDFKRFNKDYIFSWNKNDNKLSSDIFWNKSSDNLSLSVYTTRIDTVFGMTYVVMAPDHKDVEKFITDSENTTCIEYIEKVKWKSDLERTETGKDKTWVFTWSYVINPYTNTKIPVYIWDYVLGNYWTWAVMAVPAHDERDFEFAKKHHIEIIQSIASVKWEIDLTKEAYTQDWILVNSWSFTWLTSEEARVKLSDYAEENWFGTKKVNYKLRDWLFSRQRYWWEPIPLIHLELENLKKLPHINKLEEATDKNLAYILKREACAWEETDRVSCGCGSVRELVIWWQVFSKIYDWLYGKIVCDYRLPLELPEVEDFAPSWDGQSPLAKVEDFVNVKLAENLVWKRETNTMPQWWGSCWYYLRYMDNLNDNELVAWDVAKYWWEVDSYVGWAEHAVLHLLYARFWHKFLFDIWVVPTDEPFYRLKNQWLILAYSYQTKNWALIANDLVNEIDEKFYHKETREELTKVIAKMSKSLKNVVNPDDIVAEFWADSLRLYEMYMSDFKDAAPWDTKWIVWIARFLERVYRAFDLSNWVAIIDDINTESDYISDEKSIKLLHKTIKKVSEDIENYKFNTAIASLMILIKNIPNLNNRDTKWFDFRRTFIKLLHPFAPHISEELWEQEKILIEKYWEFTIETEELKKSIFNTTWPKFNPEMIIDDVVTIWVQVLGKLRWTIEITPNETQDDAMEKVMKNSDITKWLDGKEIVKIVYVPGKIFNIVVK